MPFSDVAALRFRNQLNILRSIDRHELEDVNIIAAGDAGDDAWIEFQSDPCDAFVRLGDDAMFRVWSIIDRRSSAR